MNYKANILTLFLLFFSSFLFSQNDLENNYLLSSKKFYNEINFENKIKICDSFLERAKQQNNKHFIIKGLLLKAFAYYNKDTNISLKYIDFAFKYCQNFHDTLFPAKIYRDKVAYLLEKKKFDEAIDNCNMAESFAKENNTALCCSIKNELASIKMDEIGDINGALKIYKENFDILSKRQYSKFDTYTRTYVNTIIGLSYAYKLLNKIDSVSIYTKIAYKITKKFNDNERISRLSLLNASIEIDKKNYSNCIDTLKIALPIVFKYKDSNTLLWLYYLYGRANKGLNNFKKTEYYYKKVDSINQLSKHSSTLEVLESYQFLIDYYASKGYTSKELLFTKKFKTTDSIFRRNNNELYIALQDKYEIPRLKEQQKNQNTFSKRIIITIIIIAILIITYLTIRSYRLKKEKKNFEIRFNQLINEYKNINQNLPFVNYDNEEITEIESTKINLEETSKEDSKEKKQLIIPQETINNVLNKLIDFEKLDLFLDNEMNLQKLAEFCLTNTKYLSKIINTYKEKSVVAYINDLRIDYALQQIKSNRKLLKLNISALAEEFGFNNAESFGNAFSKKTGMNPSNFINKLTNK